MKDDEVVLVERFADICNTTVPEYKVIDKAGESFLAIYVGHINEIFADNLLIVRDELSSNKYVDHVFLKESTPKPWLNSLEIQLLQRILSESLTIGKEKLESSFHRKFIPFLGGEERRIYSEANHIVYGRRGAGKSSLVLYACHQAQHNKIPYAWIALQQYRDRDDLQVIPQILYEIVDSISRYPEVEMDRIERLKNLIYALEERGDKLTKKEINQKLPIFARDFLPIVKKHGFFIFLDDLHLPDSSIQPYLLSSLYSFARGNNIHLKITAIENLTNLGYAGSKEGFQTPGDAQVILLDYNLVNPNTAYNHIYEIINNYVRYVGIPSISSIIGKDAIERLVWVSAGVPRDALYIFSNAIQKSKAADRKKIAVTDINMAAADSLTEKENHVLFDVPKDSKFILSIVNDIKEFCLKEIRHNAFLVFQDSSDERYQLLKKISDLRFIHVLHQGVTPSEAGERYEAYMLDYAFFTSFRKAPSVKEIIPSPNQQLLAKELRKLEKYRYGQRDVFKNLAIPSI